MSDIEHLPVRPNINNSYQKITKPRVSSDLCRSNLLDDSKDPDIQRFINKKKTDALELESLPTNEEKQSKESKEREKSTDPPKKEGGFSWVIIALAVVIIILIIIVIYYVLKYNEVANGTDLIPASVVKPSPINGIISGVFGGTDTKKSKIIEIMPSPRTEPTKKDLDSVLSRLSTIKEEDETVTSDSKLELKPKLKLLQPAVQTPVLKSVQITAPKIVEIVEIVEIAKVDTFEIEENEDQGGNGNGNGFLLTEDSDDVESLNHSLIEEIIDKANV